MESPGAFWPVDVAGHGSRMAGDWQVKEVGRPHIRLSPRRVRYRVGDVKKWLQERACRSTAEYDTSTSAGPGRPRKSLERADAAAAS
jgi:hypothetical protein